MFRSRDGGRTWNKVLGRGDDIGACDVVIDPTNPRIVYASLWNTRRPPWYSYAPSNGPGGGSYKSTDGGTTWKQMSNGLPAEGIGRSGIAVAPSNPRRVYAVVDCLLPVGGTSAARDTSAAATPAGRGGPAPALQGGFFRSDDGGEHWTRLSDDQALWGRGWYFEHIAVDPHDADIVYVPNVSVSRTKDGGKTWVALRGSPGGDDYHQAWVSPDDPAHRDRRQRSGHHHFAQRPRRKSRRRHLELLAQSADRTDLSRVGGLSRALLGHRRATGQRIGGGRVARQIRRDLDARLGADRRGRRERVHRGRSAPSGGDLRWPRFPLRPGAEPVGGWRGRTRRPFRLDPTAGAVHGGSARALLRQRVSLP